jgi:hypothetical protein
MKDLPNQPQKYLTEKDFSDFKKSIRFLLIFFGVIFSWGYIGNFIRSRSEYNTRYDFIIKEIDRDAKGNLTFRDSLNDEYSFSSYSFIVFDKLGIETGDKVFKDYHSEDMIFSRMKDGKYKMYYVQKPNGLFPYSLYSY